MVVRPIPNSTHSGIPGVFVRLRLLPGIIWKNKGKMEENKQLGKMTGLRLEREQVTFLKLGRCSFKSLAGQSWKLTT